MKSILNLLLTTMLLLPVSLIAAHPAQDVVRTTADQVLDKLAAEQELLEAEPDRIYGLVQEYILPHFDFMSMSRWVLGRNWRDATEAQQQEFAEEFQTLLVRTYAKALLEYSDQDIEYQPVREDGGSNLVTVRTEVKQGGSNQKIPINYTMHTADGEWKVVDVSVNGVSLVSTYRGSFSSEVRRSGIDGLIKRMSERNSGSRIAAD
ncbi:MAG: ABC transporter substrate-binding protein [Gammaproteobacteria bacterium]